MSVDVKLRALNKRFLAVFRGAGRFRGGLQEALPSILVTITGTSS